MLTCPYCEARAANTYAEWPATQCVACNRDWYAAHPGADVGPTRAWLAKEWPEAWQKVRAEWAAIYRARKAQGAGR